MMSLQTARHVSDIRTIGLVAGIELESRKNALGARAFDAFVKAFERGLLIRVTGDTIALSPPLIVERDHIELMVSLLRDILSQTS